MTIQNRKRQSTTAKITMNTLRLIVEYCTRTNSGVMLRFHGSDVGVVLGLIPSRVSDYKGWTIRKATIEAMEADLLILDCKQELGIA